MGRDVGNKICHQVQYNAIMWLFSFNVCSKRIASDGAHTMMRLLINVLVMMHWPDMRRCYFFLFFFSWGNWGLDSLRKIFNVIKVTEVEFGQRIDWLQTSRSVLCLAAQSHPTLCDHVSTAAWKVPLSTGILQARMPFPSLGGLPDPGIKLRSPILHILTQTSSFRRNFRINILNNTQNNI